MLRLATFTLRLLSAPSAVPAQTIRARLVGDASGLPLATAFAILLDGTGTRVSATLAHSAGRIVFAPDARPVPLSGRAAGSRDV